MWFHESIFNGLLDPEHKLYSDEECITCSGYVNGENNGYRSTENPQVVYRVPAHDLKAGVWSSISERRKPAPKFFS
jgi:hypothetical protein